MPFCSRPCSRTPAARGFSRSPWATWPIRSARLPQASARWLIPSSGPRRSGTRSSAITSQGRRDPAAMQWRRHEYEDGNSARTPLKKLVGHCGPPGTEDTTYSWDYANAHFVVLNEYWNGKTGPGSDVATDGDIVPALRQWLEADLATNKQPFTFVFGHEPAFPKYRHIGNSLDEHRQDRNAFWKVLKQLSCACLHLRPRPFLLQRTARRRLPDLRRHRRQLARRETPDLPRRDRREDQAQINAWRNDSVGSNNWHLANTIRLQSALLGD